MKKKIGIGFCTLLLLIITVCVGALVLYRLNVIPHKKYSNGDFNIKTYVSMTDKDLDGMDDQTDILSNVRDYIATKPKYKSKYYASGYPDDQYGVCTDVVGFGLLGAGYDLMEMVHEDIIQNRNLYHIETVDQNIDFRRVRNLQIYFKRHAISLTTNIDDIGAWQGGDIVIFKKHIGIVSDKRNKKGIAFIIHHSGTVQRYYEEDILEKRKDDIVGHYRIS